MKTNILKLLRNRSNSKKRHKIAPIILERLKDIPKGKSLTFPESNKFKASSVYSLIHRQHQKNQLLNYKVVQRKINNKNHIYILHCPPMNYLFYVI